MRASREFGWKPISLGTVQGTGDRVDQGWASSLVHVCYLAPWKVHCLGYVGAVGDVLLFPVSFNNMASANETR